MQCLYSEGDMSNQQKTELKKLFNASPDLDILQWLTLTPALSNQDVWDCWEEWQDEEAADIETAFAAGIF